MYEAVTRRSLLRRALLILGIGATGLGACVSRRGAKRASPTLQAYPEPTTGGLLGTAEMEDLVAFGEVLVERGALAPAERGYLVEHVHDRTAYSPEYLAFYRTAASTLRKLAGQPFAGLPIRERVELIDRHHLAPSGRAPGADPGPSPAEMRTLRTRVVPDLISGYYGSPAGWAVVDYQTFPGRGGDLTRYTRAEA
jgi:hypothetical protein